MVFAQITNTCESNSLIHKTARVLLIEEGDFSYFHILATIIFILAVIHTLSTHKIRIFAKQLENKHSKKIVKEKKSKLHGRKNVSFKVEILYFLNEVEVVFGVCCNNSQQLWCYSCLAVYKILVF